MLSVLGEVGEVNQLGGRGEEKEGSTNLCVKLYGGRQQHQGVLHRDAPLDDLLTQMLQVLLTVGGGQIQQACEKHADVL